MLAISVARVRLAAAPPESLVPVSLVVDLCPRPGHNKRIVSIFYIDEMVDLHFGCHLFGSRGDLDDSNTATATM